VLAVGPDEPAALVAADVVLGRPDDLAALRRLAVGCDALTFDHAQVPIEHLRALIAEGVRVYPGPDALRHIQDRSLMRRTLAGLGVPVVPELLVAGVPLLVEHCVPIRRRLAVLVARSPFGQCAVWPVVQRVPWDGSCGQTLAPAPELSDEDASAAQELALRVAGELGVVGVMAVELFETAAGLLVDELVMRPHSSGYWTIEGALTSQFEQHLRAVLDYPLGSPALRVPAAVTADVRGAATAPAMGLDERLHHLMARYPQARVHLYTTAERPGHQLGHVTVLGEQLDPVREVAARAAGFLATGHWLDGYDVHAR
jgi:5-(carboxyamino)imidazole ribonucleotide synthase